MLESISIRNFRSIVSAKLELGRVNLFIGSNGSGKSNILEAIGVLSAAFGKGLSPLDLDSKGIRLSLPHMFKATFKNREIPKTFSLEGKLAEIDYRLSVRAGDQRSTFEIFSERLWIRDNQLFGRGQNGARLYAPKPRTVAQNLRNLEPTRGMWDIVGPFADISDQDSNEINSFSRYCIYSPQTAVMRGVSVDARVNEPLGLTGGRLSTAISEMITAGSDNPQYDKWLDEVLRIIWAPGWADQVETGERNPAIVPENMSTPSDVLYIRDKYMKTGRNFLATYDASEGTLYLIFVAALLAHPRSPRVLALDNVDSSLNPGIVRKLMAHIVDIVCGRTRGAGNKEGPPDRAFETPKQIFLTSHNPTALDALDIFDKDHRIFIVSRDRESGMTLCDPLLPPQGTTKQQWVENKGGRNLSQLWLDGRIKHALG